MSIFRDNTPSLFDETKEEKARRKRLAEKQIMGKNFTKNDYEDKHISGGLLSRLTERLKPLLQAKKDINAVHSQGYFENHYPDADTQLKEVAHEQVLSALSHARELAGSEEKPKDKAAISIQINLGD